MRKILMITFIVIVSKPAPGQSRGHIIPVTENTGNGKAESRNFHKITKGGINLFIFTRERKKKIDLLAFYTLLRARVKSLFHHKKFYVVNARSAKDASAKVEHILVREKFIKNIWFDSHGHYGNRYSSFRVGTDQFSYKNIYDNKAIEYLRTIAKYCDEETNVGIGSCYAGADFCFPATDSTPATSAINLLSANNA